MGDGKERILYCGNLPEKVTEELLYELFLQAGPLESIKIPVDKSGRRRNYAFVKFKHECSVIYSVAAMQGVTLYGKPLMLDYRTGAGSVPNKYLERIVAQRRMVACQSNLMIPQAPENYARDHSSTNYTPDRIDPSWRQRLEYNCTPELYGKHKDVGPPPAQYNHYENGHRPAVAFISRQQDDDRSSERRDHRKSPYTPQSHSHRLERKDHRETVNHSSRRDKTKRH